MALALIWPIVFSSLGNPILSPPMYEFVFITMHVLLLAFLETPLVCHCIHFSRLNALDIDPVWYFGTLKFLTLTFENSFRHRAKVIKRHLDAQSTSRVWNGTRLENYIVVIFVGYCFLAYWQELSGAIVSTTV